MNILEAMDDKALFGGSFWKAVTGKPTFRGRQLGRVEDVEGIPGGVVRSATPLLIEEVSVKAGDHLLASRGFQTFYPSFTLPAPGGRLAGTDPYKVYIKDGSIPYMTSITGAQSYSRIFHLWSDDLDYSTAAVLMSMFNVSCPNKVSPQGKNVLKECTDILKEAD